jgi:hypothetical protein
MAVGGGKGASAWGLEELHGFLPEEGFKNYPLGRSQMSSCGISISAKIQTPVLQLFWHSRIYRL